MIEHAIDAPIDTSSYKQVSVVALKAKNEAEATARKDRLKVNDALLFDQVKSYATIKRSVGAVEAYFAGPQDLAGATPGDAVEASARRLADRVNGVSTALGGEAKLNDDRKGTVAGLAKLVGTLHRLRLMEMPGSSRW